MNRSSLAVSRETVKFRVFYHQTGYCPYASACAIVPCCLVGLLPCGRVALWPCGPVSGGWSRWCLRYRCRCCDDPSIEMHPLRGRTVRTDSYVDNLLLLAERRLCRRVAVENGADQFGLVLGSAVCGCFT